MTKEMIADADLRMKRSVEAFRQELLHIRTGKASIALVEPIRVEYYGSEVPLSQVASITTPDAKTIAIQPWDKSLLAVIEKAIQKSGLGLTPINNGTFIRLPVPPLTEERRRDLVKVIRRYLEEAKIAVRNIRRDSNESLKRAEKDGEISEDESRTTQEKIQELTNQHIKELEHLLELKEKEIMEV
ncbi:MAG: ribosome recycling factor [bacterium]